MHSAAIILEDRLGHEGDRLAVLVCNVLHDVLVKQHVIGRFYERIVFQINFSLATGGNFVVMAFHIKTAANHGHDHFAAQVLIVVHGRDWKIAFFVARTISEIVVLAT